MRGEGVRVTCTCTVNCNVKWHLVFTREKSEQELQEWDHISEAHHCRCASLKNLGCVAPILVMIV